MCWTLNTTRPWKQCSMSSPIVSTTSELTDAPYIDGTSSWQSVWWQSAHSDIRCFLGKCPFWMLQVTALAVKAWGIDWTGATKGLKAFGGGPKLLRVWVRGWFLCSWGFEKDLTLASLFSVHLIGLNLASLSFCECVTTKNFHNTSSITFKRARKFQPVKAH